jgi:hypothetical protein
MSETKMTLVEVNEFKVTKKLESVRNPSIRLDFLDTDKVLLGCSLNQKGVNEVILHDKSGPEILRLQGIHGPESQPTDPIGLFDSSGI